MLCTSSSTITTFFFLQRSGAHRDLHSFPTRRSSDLGAKKIAFDQSNVPGTGYIAAGPTAVGPAAMYPVPGTLDWSKAIFFAPRSEERRVGKECRSRWAPERWRKKKVVIVLEEVQSITTPYRHYHITALA